MSGLAAPPPAVASTPAGSDPAAASGGGPPAPRALADLDVCFLAFREAPAMLARHHAAVAAALGPGWSGRAVLAENGPPPATARAARELVRRSYPAAERLALRLPGNMGYARAMDLALAACRGRYVALVNSDGRPAPDMLTRLASALDAHPDAIWAAPAVHGPGEPNQPAGPPHAEPVLHGMALLVRREAFLALGAFDPLYWFYGEDDDASRRCRAAGHTLLRVPEAVFHHGKGGRSGRGRALRELFYAASHQTALHHTSAGHGLAARRVAGLRARSLHQHRADPFALAGLLTATALWPASALAAERRRRRPWGGEELARWLARHAPRVERTHLG